MGYTVCSLNSGAIYVNILRRKAEGVDSVRGVTGWRNPCGNKGWVIAIIPVLNTKGKIIYLISRQIVITFTAVNF